MQIDFGVFITVCVFLVGIIWSILFYYMKKFDKRDEKIQNAICDIHTALHKLKSSKVSKKTCKNIRENSKCFNNSLIN